MPWIWDSAGSLTLGVSLPLFSGFLPWPVAAGARPALPKGLGLDVLLGVWILLVYGVCGRESCWMIFREEIEVLDMTWSLMALLRSEILQANSSYSGAFKCFNFGGKGWVISTLKCNDIISECRLMIAYLEYLH